VHPSETTVVVAGGLNCAESLWTLVRGFERAGCRTRYVATQELHDGWKRLRPDAAERVAGACADAHLLVWWQSRFAGEASAIRALRAARPELRTAGVSVDDPYILDRLTPTEEETICAFEHAVTCCPGAFDWYTERGVKPIAGYPPCDRERQGLAKPDPEAACDLSFAVTNVYPKTRYPHVFAGRSEMVRALLGLGSIHVYGYWSESPFGWGGEYGVSATEPVIWRGFRKPEDLPGLYAASRINLNSHVRPDGWKYLNWRTVECMASGGFMLCDRVAGIDEMFSEDEEIALWSSIEELRDKARWWLGHERERRHAAEAGRVRALELFDNERLARRILRETGVC